MIAYNKIWLDNLLLLQQAQSAFKNGFITNDEWKKIRENHNMGFYTPNVFIRIGLFLLTLIICLATALLLMLIFIEDVGAQLPIVAGILAFVTYVSAEIIVAIKHHFRSGAIEALIWVFAASLLGAIADELNLSELGIFVTLYFISTWLSFRFADLLSSMVSFLSFLGILFYASKELSILAASLVPFLLMAGSCITYVVVRQFDERNILRHYKHCLEVIEIVALLALYAAGNYFVIDNLNAELLQLSPSSGYAGPFGVVFWLATVLIPPAYIIVGVIKKDFILYRAGLVLLVAMIWTIKYYYDVIPVELLMTFGGIALVAIAWWLLKYLEKGRHGYTSARLEERSVIAEQIESMVIAETFSTPANKEDHVDFGGGSFGGAGAGDSY